MPDYNGRNRLLWFLILCRFPHHLERSHNSPWPGDACARNGINVWFGPLDSSWHCMGGMDRRILDLRKEGGFALRGQRPVSSIPPPMQQGILLVHAFACVNGSLEVGRVLMNKIH